MAPEYALHGYLTDKADVYCFGIVALESAYVLQERGSLLELVDPKLGSEFNKEEAIGMITIALLRTSTSSTLPCLPCLRPSLNTFEEINLNLLE
ncbi:putative LRR receptor-like serine/threonine-protein kinase [Cinnamomum micranthum f. kanehirae]|uniref:Putative LRR receptor-like serine/threonine-protein kinase n=1 Tax=Cinnamomum micranthum f. kanehirae TaxID=337451 RepID=A0A443PZT2_9MAGN|nr:putative LRR receptor-like serine/threonine-protein kinase [Cinnamomum micranthum f. kanehirae]